MSGETEKNVSGWTVDTLKEYLDTRVAEIRKTLEAADLAADVRNEQRFIAQQQAIKDALISQKEGVASALVAAEKAVLVAETNSEKWRGNANEWRGAMNDRERTLMPRSEAEQRFTSITDAQAAGDKANSQKIEASSARIDAIASAVEKQAGRREGLMLVFAVIAALATIVSVVMAIKR